jgi:uncharacterized membrane protein
VYTPPQTSGLTDNVASALCYAVGFVTGVLFLVLAPYNQNRNIRFHAFQSIFFHVAWIVLWMVVQMFLRSVGYGFLGGMVSLLVGLISLGVGLAGVALWIFLMFKAYNGERFHLPVLGDLAEKQA